MRGAPYVATSFARQFKNYQGSSDQGTHFVEFLAKCYVAHQQTCLFGDHCMWNTSAPWLPIPNRRRAMTLI